MLVFVADVDAVEGSYKLLLPMIPGFEPLLFQRLWMILMSLTLMSLMFLAAQPNWMMGAVEPFCTTTFDTVTSEW